MHTCVSDLNISFRGWIFLSVYWFSHAYFTLRHLRGLSNAWFNWHFHRRVPLLGAIFYLFCSREWKSIVCRWLQNVTISTNLIALAFRKRGQWLTLCCDYIACFQNKRIPGALAWMTVNSFHNSEKKSIRCTKSYKLHNF